MPHKHTAHIHGLVFMLLTCSGVVPKRLPANVEGSRAECGEHTSGQQNTVVTTLTGTVKGLIMKSVLRKPVRIFYGIPYAEPPVGKLRFSRSKPKRPWSGTFDATVKPNSCVQATNSPFGNFRGAAKWIANTNISEDCLKLNIWTPVPPPEKAAVLVWIYGGGFFSGTSTLDMYDAQTLVSNEDVIVVAMNYRVASLGFLSFGNELLPGNAGLYDQYLAFKWIRDNIAAFGGDRNRVTLFGESSGAASIGLHLLSPLSRNLFSRAILESGSALSPWAIQNNKTARKLAAMLADALGCPQTLDQDTLDCLYRKEASDIVNNEPRCKGVVTLPFVPVADGILIPKSPRALVDEKAFQKNVSLLIGSNLNEGNFYLEQFFLFPLTDHYPNISRENFTTALRSLDPSKGVPPFEEVLKVYSGGVVPPMSDDKLKVLDKIVGDYHFSCPAVQFANRLIEDQVQLYQYVFARRSSREAWPLWMGVIHSAELAFVFGAPFNATLQYENQEKALSGRVMRYWTNFAKHGNPNHPSEPMSALPTWPQRTSRSGKYLVLDVEERVVSAYRAPYCKFWESIRNNRALPTC